MFWKYEFLMKSTNSHHLKSKHEKLFDEKKKYEKLQLKIPNSKFNLI